MDRIKNLDGLRALAALGVLWVHCWGFFGHPRYYIAGIDLASVLAIGGNGVDLFFVISGFCMYYFYTRREAFTWSDFRKFLVKRWVRLSPAFYAVTLVYLLAGYVSDPGYPVLGSAATSLFYLNSIFPKYTAASLFWTLGVEMQFYFAVSFILIYEHALGFGRAFTGVLLLFLVTAVACILILKNRADILSEQLIFRYFEFMWGILVARLVVLNRAGKGHSFFWAAFFVLLAYSGRLLISGPALALISYPNFFRIAGFTIMGSGFAGLVYLSLRQTEWLTLLLGNPVISLLGRVSYSFYLWHGLVHTVIGRWISSAGYVENNYRPLLTFALSAAVLLPLSMISYRLLEKPFLKKPVLLK